MKVTMKVEVIMLLKREEAEQLEGVNSHRKFWPTIYSDFYTKKNLNIYYIEWVLRGWGYLKKIVCFVNNVVFCFHAFSHTAATAGYPGTKKAAALRKLPLAIHNLIATRLRGHPWHLATFWPRLSCGGPRSSRRPNILAPYQLLFRWWRLLESLST